MPGALGCFLKGFTKIDWYEDDLIFFLGKLYNDTLVEEQPELLATTKYCFFMRFVYLGLFGKLLFSPCFEKQEEGDYTPNELTRWPMVALGAHSGVDSGMLDTIPEDNSGLVDDDEKQRIRGQVI